MLGNSEAEKRKIIRDYFDARTDWIAWCLILFGLPMIAVFFIGLFMIGYGIYRLFRKKGKAADKKIDKWISEELAAHDFVRRAYVLSNFHEIVRDPIILHGMANSSLEKNVISSSVVGDDGLLRSTPLGITVVLCSPDQIGLYQAGIDLITGNLVNEVFVEAFYQDVVGISLQTTTDTLDFKGASQSIASAKLDIKEIQKGLTKTKLRNNLSKIRQRFDKYVLNDILQRQMARIYKIDFVDGEHISIPIADGRPTRLANSDENAMSGDAAAQNIALLRNFVRERKRQLLNQIVTGAGPLV